MKFFFAAFFWLAATAVRASYVRIANQGETAAPAEFPYQVSLKGLIGEQVHFCGGALISKRQVLTAAHCVQAVIDIGEHALSLTAEVGSIFLGYGKSYAIKRISYRKGYSLNGNSSYGKLFLPNDIAVVHLKTDVEYNENVKPIGLPERNSELPEGTKVIVSGFGASKISGPLSYRLKQIEIETVSLKACQSYHKAILQNTNICAASTSNYGTCVGDSGGPMVNAEKKILVGIVSGGNGKCGSGNPDVFTKVSHFIEYIEEEMKLDLNAPQITENPALDLQMYSRSVA